MSARTRTPRLALLAGAGTIALSLGALAMPGLAQAHGGDKVIGPVTVTSGNGFEVAAAGGIAKVAYSDDTRAAEAIPAQLAEITPGSCIKAGPGTDTDAVTAKWVMIGTPVNGQCGHPPADGTPAPAPAHRHGVRGTVDSVNGDTINVTRRDGSHATVTVNNDTNYRRRVPSNPHAVTPGRCVVAHGTKDAEGVLQATRVMFWTSPDGQCPQPGN